MTVRSRWSLAAVLLLNAAFARSGRADEPPGPPSPSPPPVTSVSGSGLSAPAPPPAAPPAPPPPGATSGAPTAALLPPPPLTAGPAGWFAPPAFREDLSPSVPHRRERLPREITYKPGMPVFAGYSLQHKRPGWPLAIGLSFFGVGYLGAVVIGAVGGGISSEQDAWAPMFVPVVGPFVAVETAKSSIEFDGERVAMVASAAFQITGIAITALRWVLPERHVLVLDRKALIRPAVSGGLPGLVATF